jgi:hypothetical protein
VSSPRVRGCGGAEEGPAALRRTGPTQPRDVRQQRRIQPWALQIVMNCDARGR